MSRIIRSYIVDIVETDDVIYCDNDGHLTYNIEADKNELVRCKDCRYRTELPYVDKDTHEPIYDCGYNISPLWGEENGYCSHGERRE